MILLLMLLLIFYFIDIHYLILTTTIFMLTTACLKNPHPSKCQHLAVSSNFSLSLSCFVPLWYNRKMSSQRIKTTRHKIQILIVFLSFSWVGVIYFACCIAVEGMASIPQFSRKSLKWGSNFKINHFSHLQLFRIRKNALLYLVGHSTDKILICCNSESSAKLRLVYWQRLSRICYSRM